MNRTTPTGTHQVSGPGARGGRRRLGVLWAAVLSLLAGPALTATPAAQAQDTAPAAPESATAPAYPPRQTMLRNATARTLPALGHVHRTQVRHVRVVGEGCH
ncbi:hypothetical protein [Streptomyces sp. NPDC057557]|uniref:hypothetical protein n=1 Tax=Streptomyces sp. NPDC057557 TaxID=3346167 RepID=UPI0036A74492